MKANMRAGYLASALLLVAILSTGVYISELEPVELHDWDPNHLGNIIPSGNEMIVRDQILTRNIVKKSRLLLEDLPRAEIKYSQLEPFVEPADDRLDPVDVQNYIGVVRNWREGFKSFRRKMGNKPGFFRVVAMYGMIGNLVEFLEKDSLVKYKITKEEFDWIRVRIMEAAAYSVQYKLDNEEPSPEEREDLELLLHNIFMAAGIIERDPDGNEMYFAERYKPNQIPKGNIELFLNNYKDIDYTMVRFNDVEFDKEAILKSAADNPE